jgi:hypothetical protein
MREYVRIHGSEPYGVARTQRRHISGANELFALSTELVNSRSRVVTITGVGMADLVSATTRARDGPDIVAQGAMSKEILQALGAPSRAVFTGISRLGVDREYWGRPA